MSPVAAPVQTIPTGSTLPVGVPGATITPKFQVRVRYPKRMKVQRVYRMTVELRPEKGATASVSAGDSVIARPLVPGAYVQPPDQELGPKASNNKITFSIAPLAKGRLKNARMQILHQGRVLEEIRTSMRGTSQRKTLLFAFLAILSLAYMVEILGPLPDLSTRGTGDGGSAAAGVVNIMLDKKLPDYLKKEELPEGFVADYLSREAIASGAQEAYDYVYKIDNLNAYITGSFLLLTLVFLIRNRPVLWRKTRKGKPMMLPSLPA
jgi:hypothetical protein